MVCPYCGREAAKSHTFCAGCGFRLPSHQNSQGERRLQESQINEQRRVPSPPGNSPFYIPPAEFETEKTPEKETFVPSETTALKPPEPMPFTQEPAKVSTEALPMQQVPAQAPQAQMPPVQQTSVQAPQGQMPPVQQTPVQAPQGQMPSVQQIPVQAPQVQMPSVQQTPVQAPQAQMLPVQKTPVQARPTQIPSKQAMAVHNPPRQAFSDETRPNRNKQRITESAVPRRNRENVWLYICMAVGIVLVVVLLLLLLLPKKENKKADPSESKAEEQLLDAPRTILPPNETTKQAESAAPVPEQETNAAAEPDPQQEPEPETSDGYGRQEDPIAFTERRIGYSGFTDEQKSFCLGEYLDADGQKVLFLSYLVPKEAAIPNGPYASLWRRNEDGTFSCLTDERLAETSDTEDFFTYSTIRRINDVLYFSPYIRTFTENKDISKSRYYSIGEKLILTYELCSEAKLLSRGDGLIETSDDSFSINQFAVTRDEYINKQDELDYNNIISEVCPFWSEGMPPKGQTFEALKELLLSQNQTPNSASSYTNPTSKLLTEEEVLDLAEQYKIDHELYTDDRGSLEPASRGLINWTNGSYYEIVYYLIVPEENFRSTVWYTYYVDAKTGEFLEKLP